MSESESEQSSYDYACMRAELLGQEKPDKDTFLQEMKEKLARQQLEEDLEIKQLQESEMQNEELKNISGGLDELNSILTITQKKINRFKVACGSLTNLLKIKAGHSNSNESINKDSNEENNESLRKDSAASDGLEKGSEEQNIFSSDEIKNDFGIKNDFPTEPRKKDYTKMMDSHISSLDSMLTKAENAHFSMAKQNQQMRQFLKK